MCLKYALVAHVKRVVSTDRKKNLHSVFSGTLSKYVHMTVEHIFPPRLNKVPPVVELSILFLCL